MQGQTGTGPRLSPPPSLCCAEGLVGAVSIADLATTRQTLIYYLLYYMSHNIYLYNKVSCGISQSGHRLRAKEPARRRYTVPPTEPCASNHGQPAGPNLAAATFESKSATARISSGTKRLPSAYHARNITPRSSTGVTMQFQPTSRIDDGHRSFASGHVVPDVSPCHLRSSLPQQDQAVSPQGSALDRAPSVRLPDAHDSFKALRPPPTPGPQTFDQDTVLRCAAEGRILRISVEVTRACNLDCVYCYVPVTPSTGAPLSHAELLQVAQDGLACGARTFVLIGGEPLQYPRLTELIKQLCTMGYTVSLFSNLTQLTPEIASFLQEHDVFVTGKLNSLDAKLEDFLTQRAGSHRTFLTAIDLLRRCGFTTGGRSHLALHAVIAKENVQDIPSLFRWMRRAGIIPHLQLLTRTGRARHALTALSPQEAKSLFVALLDIDRSEFGYDWIPTPPLVGWSCQQYYCSLYITNDGRIKPCSSSATVLGSVRTMSMRSILDLPLLKQLRDIRPFIEGPCRTCCKARLCYGCRADAEAVGGHLFASDAYCWEGR